jgi:predicted site-specific integrase-resolvase
MFCRRAVYNLIRSSEERSATGPLLQPLLSTETEESKHDLIKADEAVLFSSSTKEAESGRIEAIYARVSTRKQLEYLKTQIQGLKQKYPSSVVFRDCASGLNFRRKGLVSLLQRVLRGDVRVVHLAYRDRLCRFAYDLIEHIFKHHNTAITVESHDALSPESELADDVLSIITVFSARMHGRRSGVSRGVRGGVRPGCSS